MGTAPAGRGRAHRWVGAAAAACVAGGAVLLSMAACGQQDPPEPPLSAPSAASSAASVPSPAPASSTSPAAAAAAAPAAAPVAAPEPTSLTIPAIGVRSPLLHLGLAPDGTAAVPAPGPDYDEAAWFTGSPTPGSVGPAVIEGHIDSAADGPSVFFRLGALRPGDRVDVGRAGGSTASFSVTRVERYAKDDFPTLDVYGNTTGPELRLITCGGAFDRASGHYTDNTVVYATLLPAR